MDDELSRAAERVRQNRAARAPTNDATPRSEATPTSRPSGIVVAGDRVFDIVSGLEGDVTRASGFGAAPFGTVNVRLDDGSTVTRRPIHLLWRPTPPAAAI